MVAVPGELKQSVLSDATNEALRAESASTDSQDAEDRHAQLNSGHSIPRLGWGSFHTQGTSAKKGVKDAVNAGFRVQFLRHANLQCCNVAIRCDAF